MGKVIYQKFDLLWEERFLCRLSSPRKDQDCKVESKPAAFRKFQHFIRRRFPMVAFDGLVIRLLRVQLQSSAMISPDT